MLASLWTDLKYTPLAASFRMLANTAGPWPELDRVRSPVLALLAAQSTMTDPARTREALAGLRDCSIVELDALHWIPTEQPQAMREAIDAWLEARFPPQVLRSEAKQVRFSAAS